MPEEAKLFIFDVGGVMVDGFNVMPKVARHLGLAEQELRTLLMEAGFVELSKGLISEAAFLQRLNGHHLKASDRTLLGDFFQPSRREGMYEYVARLKERGKRVVAGTNTIPVHYDIHSERGDYDIFHTVYASHLISEAKPEPAFYRRILESEDIVAEDAVFVDDMEANVEAANAIGIHGIHYTSLESMSRQLERFL